MTKVHDDSPVFCVYALLRQEGHKAHDVKARLAA